MKTKIKANILAKPNLATLMQHDKKTVDSVFMWLAAVLTHRLFLVKNVLVRCIALSRLLICVQKKKFLEL